MGNVLLLPCMCKEEARVAVQATAGGAKKTKRIKRPAVGNKNVVLSQEQGDGGEKMVPWQEVAAGEEYGVRVKVVMTRKDAAEFMARLEERPAAAERKARKRTGGSQHRRRCGEPVPGSVDAPSGDHTGELA